MTDYQPLLARAIGGLERNTGEARRAIYDRARQALLNQLRAVNPPLAETDITRERLALEDAIRKIETQAAQANPELVRTARAPAAAPSVAPRAPAPAPAAAAAVPREAVSAAAQPRQAAPVRPPVMGTAEPRMPAPPAARGGPPARDFNRAPPRAPQSLPQRPGSAREIDGEETNENRSQREIQANAQTAGRAGGMRIPQDDIEYLPEDGTEKELNRPRGAPNRDDHSPMSPGDFAPGPRSRRLQSQPEPRSRTDARSGLRAKLLVGGLVALLFAVAVLLAYLHRDRMLALLGVGPSGSQVASDPDKPKTGDRVSPQVSAQPRPAAPAVVAPTVSQAATLYEENPGGAQQFQNFPGTVVWRTENITGPGRAPDLGLRIEIEIPDRKMNVTLLLRRNMDTSFPASHTLEIQFNTPGDPFGGISNVKGMRAKNAEAANGSVLFMSEPEKIKEGDVLFALPDTQLDQNVQLLRERPWFDIAFFYSNGRRGVLAFEKGTPGERAINDALAAWGQGG